MKKFSLAFVLYCGLLLSLNVAASTECKIPLLQLQTGPADGLHIYSVSNLKLDFCVGAITCPGWSNTPVYSVTPGIGCTDTDIGYIVCNWPLEQTVKIGYHQAGEEVRVEVQNESNILIAKGYANQKAQIINNDFLITITTNDLCPQ